MNEPSSGLAQILSGWGRYPLLSGHLYRPEKVTAFTETLASAHHASVLARGYGRSYGDAAVNPTGLTVLTERLNRMLHFDERTGLLHCEAGVTIEEILEVFVPRGWFPAVTPGTKFVTLGGAVAFDVHGKNHHQDGSFARYVQGLKVVLASGEAVWCSPQENSDLFWATVGGMGLTGLITEVEFSLRPIQTGYIKNRSIKAKNLDEAIGLFEEYKTEYKYSVAWIDCLASGKALGRSILGFGEHAALSDLPAAQQRNPLNVSPKRRLKVSFDLPEGLLNPFTIRSFNALYFAKQLGQDIESIVDYDSFFYPLDFLWNWNRLYGKRGFVQYQCAIPQETSREALTQILQLCSEQGWGSFLAVLKQLGEQEGWLSFPIPGYTLALDMPVRPGLWEFLEQLDQLVIRYGGRLYLAKDARLSAEAFRAMYPKFPQWLAVKTKVDPENRFTSALSKRLQIEPVRATAKA